jgi:hypothetical protein
VFNYERAIAKRESEREARDSEREREREREREGERCRERQREAARKTLKGNEQQPHLNNRARGVRGECGNRAYHSIFLDGSRRSIRWIKTRRFAFSLILSMDQDDPSDGSRIALALSSYYCRWIQNSRFPLTTADGSRRSIQQRQR